MNKLALLFTFPFLVVALSCCDNKKDSTPLFIEDGKYKLFWADEFELDGKPDTSHWSYEHGFVRNEEWQWYQEENATCKDGLLIIEGRRERINNDRYDSASDRWQKQRRYAEYTSSSLNTRGKMDFQYGVMLVRARIDTIMGMWPAIWTLGTNKEWPANGEIDVMEYYRWKGTASILANAAWMGADGKAMWDDIKIPFDHFTSRKPNWSDDFHIWKMKWTPDAIEIFLDDELLNSIELSQTINPDGFNPFKQPHYILLNLAIGSNGGDPTATSFPRKYEIDYVRIYQLVEEN